MTANPLLRSLTLASLCALATGAVQAQPAPASSLRSPTKETVAPSVLTAPPPRIVTPAPAVRTAPGIPAAVLQQPPVNAVVTPPKAASPAAAVAKQALPDALFSMEDRAIIIVGGKPRAAGDIKREIKAELQRQSGPAKMVRSVSRLKAVPMQQVMENTGGGPKPKFGAGALATAPAIRHDAAGTPSAAVKLGAVRTDSYMDAKTYCRTHAPEITRVRGALTPNQRFTIEGLCFGDSTGSVQVIGQFAGGNMKLVFERWTDGEIVAFVPAVRGAADHAVALTVVRNDKTRSPAAQAKFVATRERIEVPGRYWSPGEYFSHIGVAQGGGNIFSGFTVHSASAGSFTTPFALSINKECALDNAAWSSTTGRVDAFNGWDEGPLHEAKVSVIWTPRCTTQTTNYVVGSSSQRICSVSFNLKAWAQCPLGVAP